MELEMADMDASPVIEGKLARAGEMTDFLPLARILRGKLDDLIAGAGEVDPEMRAILKFAGSHLRSEWDVSSTSSYEFRPVVEGGDTCAQQPAELDCCVWSRLPEELQELVLARLPIPDVHRLRCLSKKWRQAMAEKSRFKDLCAETNSKIFALINIDPTHKNRAFCVKLYEITTNKWHIFKLYVGNWEKGHFKAVCATHGGLVCFISEWVTSEAHPLQIVVCNPLTQDMRTLTVKGLITHQVKMMQILTNHDTHHYKIILVATHPNNEDRYFAKLFDSMIEDWVNLDQPAEGQPLYCDIFSGIYYVWYWKESLRKYTCLHSDSIDLCVWDCAEQNVKVITDDSEPLGGMQSVYDYTLCRDRLFVLHQKCLVDNKDNTDDDGGSDGTNDLANLHQPGVLEVDQLCITEYQGGQTRHANWVKLRTIDSSPKLCPSKIYPYFNNITLHASEDFLLLVIYNRFHRQDPYHENIWLYDLSSDIWRALPNFPGGIGGLELRHDAYTLMCELRWDADVHPLNVATKQSLLLK